MGTVRLISPSCCKPDAAAGSVVQIAGHIFVFQEFLDVGSQNCGKGRFVMAIMPVEALALFKLESLQKIANEAAVTKVFAGFLGGVSKDFAEVF